MYFYEVIEKCDIEEAVRCFLKMCVNSPDIEHTEQCIRHAIADIKAIETVKSDSEVIQIERVKTDEEEYDAVHMVDEASDTKYGLEVNPWKYTLGYTVDEKSLSGYGDEKFVSLVLWEMTWFGYDEKTIQDHVKSWDEAEYEVRDLSDV
jgi:hypothetical protein